MATLIQNGRVVTPRASERADLRISDDGVIEAIGKGLSAEGCTVFDASGCALFPGLIDAHTHLDMDTGTALTADDFASGTAGAICGGTTTLIDFATQDKGQTLTHALETWHKKAQGKSACDYAFHMAITDWNEQTASEIPEMAKAGVTSFKLYMAYEALRVRDGEIYEILQAVSDVHGLIGMHCENGDLVNRLVAARRAAGDLSPAAHPRSRPDYVEAEAISRYCRIAQAAGTPVHIVHLSSAEGLREIRAARARGQKVYVEGCPQYFTLDDSLYDLPDFEGAKYVCSPPLRKKADQQALWEALAAGEIHTISTDHCSFRFAGQKQMGRDDFSKIPNGMPGLEYRPAAMYTAGVASGLLTENQFAALLSENAARLFGLYPRKGVLAVGSDADIVVWDPVREGVISAATHHHNCDYTPYEGMKTKGSAKAVFLRGQQVVADGQLLCPDAGRYVARGACEYL